VRRDSYQRRYTSAAALAGMYQPRNAIEGLTDRFFGNLTPAPIVTEKVEAGAGTT
jgi:hypothetical protein